MERRKLVSLESLLAAPRGERASVGARLFESEGGRIHLVEDFGPFALSIPGPGRYALPDGSQLWVRLLPKPKELRGQANRRLFSCRDVVLSPACPQPAKRGSGGALRTGGIQSCFRTCWWTQAAKVAAATAAVVEKDGCILFVPPAVRSKHHPVLESDENAIEIEYQAADE